MYSWQYVIALIFSLSSLGTMTREPSRRQPSTTLVSFDVDDTTSYQEDDQQLICSSLQTRERSGSLLVY